MLHGGICQNSLLQFFLRVSKGAAGSARTASLLLHVTTHICLVLAVLRRLKERQVLLKQKTYTLVYPIANPWVIMVKPYSRVLPSTTTNKTNHTGMLILNMTEQYWVILLKSISSQTCTASKCISTSLIIDVLMMVVRERINSTTQRAWPRFFSVVHCINWPVEGQLLSCCGSEWSPPGHAPLSSLRPVLSRAAPM